MFEGMQAVNKGDCVLVLEAMKMNTTACASRAGTVVAIKIPGGDAAEAGQTLN